MSQFKKKLKKIKCLIMDVDGVLTDGRIIVDDTGKELKNFDVQDGLGIVLLQKAGYKTAIISARTTPSVKARAKDLKIGKVYQAALPKTVAYAKVLKDYRLKDEEVCFIGDDLTDLSVLKRVGFSVSVPNGVKEVKSSVDYVTKRSGGRGAVREVVEMILNENGFWDNIMERLSK